MQIANFTNDPILLKQNIIATIDAEAYVMGEAPMTASFEYPLGDTAHSYTFEGEVGPMALEHLNPLLVPSSQVRVNSGQAQKCTFIVTANKRSSWGWMRLWYTDLNVSVVNEKLTDFEPTLVRKIWGTFFANTVVLSHNPRRNYLRVGRIDYETDPQRGFTYHWTKALESGLKSSVGLTNKEEKDRKFGLKRLTP